MCGVDLVSDTFQNLFTYDTLIVPGIIIMGCHKLHIFIIFVICGVNTEQHHANILIQN